MRAVGFSFDRQLGEVADVQLDDVTVRVRDDRWFVAVDAEGKVAIHAREGGKLRVIGRGVPSGFGDRLTERTGALGAEDWKVVETAIARVRRRAIASAPVWRRWLAHIDPGSRPILLRAILMGLAAIGVAMAIFALRSKDPAPTTLGGYHTLAWSDVAGGGETTVPLIRKDPERERGRKLCIIGTVDDITRATIEGRAVHAGALQTPAGDRVAFIAVGSTRSVVARSPATLCGVAIGTRGDAAQVVGLFDLPENRTLER